MRAARGAGATLRRRPRLALAAAVVLALGAFLLPLAADLFFAIPWPTRKATGWVTVAGLLGLGLARLMQVRPTDGRPLLEGEAASRWFSWILPLACTALAWPLLRHPENLSRGDWDWFLGRYEAVRQTILVWGQFPWWDPWSRGGFPLAANPQCGVAGIATPLVLAFGTSVGMRLATLVCFLLAAEGTRRLAGRWLADPYAAVAAGLIYALNGGVLVAAVAAYHVPMSYCALPWLIDAAARLDRRAGGFWLGFWMALGVLNGIQYLSAYAALVAALAWLRGVRERSGPARTRFLAQAVVALGTFLALAGWRLATVGSVLRDFPRLRRSGWDETPWSIVHLLLGRPSAATLARMEIPQFWETSCYVGPVVLGLALASLAWGWRWWHTLALVCGWLAAGSVAWYHPSYWLAHLPGFATMHVVTRWRFVALLGVALAAASVLARWRRSARPALRLFAVILIGVIAADYLAYGFQILHVGFSVSPTEDQFPGPPVAPVVQIDTAPMFAAVRRGYGVIHGIEPLMGYVREAPTARLWRGHPGYIGESWTADGPVRPRSWSPNRITFQVAPHQEVHVNQNPGSWWVVNGRPAFPDGRCAEKEQPFVARADARGRLELRIRPQGLVLGLWLHAAGIALLAGSWIGGRVRRFGFGVDRGEREAMGRSQRSTSGRPGVADALLDGGGPPSSFSRWLYWCQVRSSSK